jgi:methylglutaconyl-CoA hydratase
MSALRIHYRGGSSRIPSHLLRLACVGFTDSKPVATTVRHHIGYYAPIRSLTFSTTTTTTAFGNKQQLQQQKQRHILLQHHTNDEFDAKISVMTLNRPKANAMGYTMLSQLKESIYQLEKDHIPLFEDGNIDTDLIKTQSLGNNASRCLVITSSVPNVFSAGADLKERATMTIEEAEEFVSDLRMTIDRISQLQIPVIVAIEGVALGGGFEIALAADIRIASTTSKFGLPETSLAILPGAGGTQRLPRLIGTARAKELIFTGRRIDGTTAERYGIVQHVVPQGTAYSTAIEMAWQIASNGPIAVRASKYSIDHGLSRTTMHDALTQVERIAYAKTLSTQDRLEGLAAFHDKRTPKYKGE